MACQYCGAACGKYVLCFSCNELKEEGLLFRCPKCNRWHQEDDECYSFGGSSFLYNPRKALLTASEQGYFSALQKVIPEGFYVFPQVNLAAIVERTDDSKYRNELFRNVDFVISDAAFKVKIVVEINDRSHTSKQRRERDEKVRQILEEAGVPLLTLWTSYGVNQSYISEKVKAILANQQQRIHHFVVEEEEEEEEAPRRGCYIATCVYGSYDCPNVWILRRYRDFYLAKSRIGRAFIKVYYKVSPILVQYFGELKIFRSFFKRFLDQKVAKLKAKGYSDVPYQD